MGYTHLSQERAAPQVGPGKPPLPTTTFIESKAISQLIVFDTILMTLKPRLHRDHVSIRVKFTSDSFPTHRDSEKQTRGAHTGQSIISYRWNILLGQRGVRAWDGARQRNLSDRVRPQGRHLEPTTTWASPPSGKRRWLRNSGTLPGSRALAGFLEEGSGRRELRAQHSACSPVKVSRVRCRLRGDTRSDSAGLCLPRARQESEQVTPRVPWAPCPVLQSSPGPGEAPQDGVGGSEQRRFRCSTRGCSARLRWHR